MKRIEAKTCIRFRHIRYPQPGKKSLVILREGRPAPKTTTTTTTNDPYCYKDYIIKNLQNIKVNNVKVRLRF